MYNSATTAYGYDSGSEFRFHSGSEFRFWYIWDLHSEEKTQIEKRDAELATIDKNNWNNNDHKVNKCERSLQMETVINTW